MSERIGGYYDLRCGMIETRARLTHRTPTESNPARVEALGVHFGTPFTPDELAAWGEAWDGAYDDLVDAVVRDNGDCGDGLWIAFEAHSRAREPDGEKTLFAVELTVEQARLLATALQGAVHLRDAQARSYRR